jgi:hypothetical protein
LIGRVVEIFQLLRSGKQIGIYIQVYIQIVFHPLLPAVWLSAQKQLERKIQNNKNEESFYHYDNFKIKAVKIGKNEIIKK